MIFDSHAHYDDEAFKEDQSEVLEKIQLSGVKRILNCGSSIESSERTVELAKRHDFIYGACGIHPDSADQVKSNLNKIGDLLKGPKLVAVGEIGLDYYYKGFDRETQLRAFREQMDLAAQLKLPVIIHDRDAHEDTLKVIDEFKGVTGVLHCFSGSLEFSREVLKRGYYLGFTGVITFKNAKKAVGVLKEAPADRILVETDCPYMAPVPHRGERNDSSFLVHTLSKMAEIRGIGYDEACRLTWENASEMLNIKE